MVRSTSNSLDLLSSSILFFLPSFLFSPTSFPPIHFFFFGFPLPLHYAPPPFFFFPLFFFFSLFFSLSSLPTTLFFFLLHPSKKSPPLPLKHGKVEKWVCGSPTMFFYFIFFIIFLYFFFIFLYIFISFNVLFSYFYFFVFLYVLLSSKLKKTIKNNKIIIN